MNALQTRTRCLTALALFLLLACGKDSPGETARAWRVMLRGTRPATWPLH